MVLLYPDQPLDAWEDTKDILTRPVPDAANADIHPNLLCLPSNRNCDNSYGDAKICTQIKQATGHLEQIREAIAEKSFMYSDVLHNAPNQGVRTRAHGAIKALTHRIFFHAQVYMHCCKNLVHLGVDNMTLRQFRVLKVKDVRASTMVLNPNLYSSTQLRLSWIWHAVQQQVLPSLPLENDPQSLANSDIDEDNEETNPATILECE